MKINILLALFILTTSTSYAAQHQLTLNKSNAKLSSALAVPNNSINWSLNKSGDQMSIYNSSLPTMVVDVYLNPLNNNKTSDTVLIDCNNSGAYLAAGVDTLCEIPYVGVMLLASVTFANGASGHYSILGHYNTPTTWNLSAPGTVTVLNNATSQAINVLYYVDYYYNNTASISGTVQVSCVNKTFSVNNGSARICQLPPGASAQVLLDKYYGQTSSGGFMVLP